MRSRKVEKHKDVMAAKIAMKSVLAAAQAGASVTPTIEGSMTSGLAQEAAASLDTTNPKQLESISVEERTSLNIFVTNRIEF